MEMKVADVIVKCLEAEGIEYAFGISGSHYLAFFKALKNSSIKFISVKHESSASLMALQYAQFAQKPALIMGTAGPGALNLVAGIAELFKLNLPCFVLSPIVSTDLQGKNSFQEDSGCGNSYSIVDLMSCITKKSLTCQHPENISYTIHDLFRRCLYGRKGPVHLLVPTNFFEKEVDYAPLQVSKYRIVTDKCRDPECIRLIAEEIRASKTPLLFIGQRAWYPNISESIETFSANFGIPVVLSANAKGLFNEYSPRFAGIFDLYGHRSAEVIIKQSDCIISLGEDFGEFATNKYEPQLFSDKLLQIDIDGYDIGRNYSPKLCTSGNMQSILETLAIELQCLDMKPLNVDGLSEAFMKENTAMLQESADESLPLKPQRFLKELSNLVPENALIVGDIGANSYFSLRSLKVRSGAYSIAMSNYTMGQGVAGALGAKLAAPSKLVISLCGDGALLMHGMEMATARQYDIPILWIVIVNKRYGAVDWAQKLIYNDLDYCVDLFLPDLGKFSEAFGVGHYRADNINSVREGFSKAVERYQVASQSSLLEIIIDPDELLPLKPRSVKFIQDICNLNNFNASPYLMKAFKRMLREKV